MNPQNIQSQIPPTPQDPSQAIPQAAPQNVSAIIPQATADVTITQADAPAATQTTLLISELRDGMVIMKDGSFRAVIACKSINFDLMSESEREAVEYSYQGFINSLNFPTQIMIRSQRVDIGPYLERLSDIRRNTDNMLLGVLMDDYINFIDILSQEANIMDKSFFIIIPYYTTKDAEKVITEPKNIFSGLLVPKNQPSLKLTVSLMTKLFPKSIIAPKLSFPASSKSASIPSALTPKNSLSSITTSITQTQQSANRLLIFLK